MEPLISVIVPVYNAEKYLRQCIESIINQTYKNIEIILVNDGSTDNSGAICDEYLQCDDRINIIHKNNEGPSSARNAGLSVSKGDWISFVDSDDWIENELYSTLVRNINEDDKLLMFGLQRVNDRGVYRKINVDQELIYTDGRSFNLFIKYLSNSMIGFTPNKLYSKQIIKDTFFLPIKLREDLCFNIDVLNKITAIKCIEYVGYNYRDVPTSILHTPDINNCYGLKIGENKIKNGIKGFSKKENREIYNKIMLISCTDVILKDIIQNKETPESEKMKLVQEIFRNKSIKKNLSFLYCTNNLHRIFCLTIKLGAYKFFYKLILKLLYKV